MAARAKSKGVASMFKWIALLILMTLPVVAQAETQYIVDQLTVPLRRGPSNAHKIIHAGLPSGTALEIVGSGFTQVRTSNGTDGWVPTQYLTPEPAARDRVVQLNKRIEALTAELTALRQGVKAEQSARSSVEGTASDLGKQVKQLQTELADIKRVSANSVAMYEENKALKIQNEQLQLTVSDQAGQIKSLKSSEVQMWLLIGGGLVLLGLIFGVVIKSRPKSKGGW
jgi:SH3 domain protein